MCTCADMGWSLEAWMICATIVPDRIRTVNGSSPGRTRWTSMVVSSLDAPPRSAGSDGVNSRPCDPSTSSRAGAGWLATAYPAFAWLQTLGQLQSGNRGCQMPQLGSLAGSREHFDQTLDHIKLVFGWTKDWSFVPLWFDGCFIIIVTSLIEDCITHASRRTWLCTTELLWIFTARPSASDFFIINGTSDRDLWWVHLWIINMRGAPAP